MVPTAPTGTTATEATAATAATTATPASRLAALLAAGLVRSDKQPIKILGDGELSRSVTIKAQHFSKSAREKIEKAGGQAEVI